MSKLSTVTAMRPLGVAILMTVVAFGPSWPCGMSKALRVTQIWSLGVAILVIAIAIGPSCPRRVSSIVNSHSNAAPRGRHPRNCRSFWTPVALWRVKSLFRPPVATFFFRPRFMTFSCDFIPDLRSRPPLPTSRADILSRPPLTTSLRTSGQDLLSRHVTRTRGSKSEVLMRGSLYEKKS